MALILSGSSIRSISAKIIKFQPSSYKILNVAYGKDESILNKKFSRVCISKEASINYVASLNFKGYHTLTFNHAHKNNLENNPLLKNEDYFKVPFASLKNRITRGINREVERVPTFKDIEIPEDGRLEMMVKLPPQEAPGLFKRKMQKSLHYIRGEEEVHTDFIHGQYGIIALRGGYLKHGHFDMIRNEINRRINIKKCFAIYRVDTPWKAHTKKGIGKRMGQGKGSISYYSTPVKAKRVIIEIAGKVTFEEVKRMLDIVAHKLPFPAVAMSQEMLDEQRREEIRLEKENINHWTFKYIIQNNMLGSRFWAKKEMDLKYFGKYE